MVIDDVKHLVSQRYSPEVTQSLLESSVRDVSDLLFVLSAVDLVVASRFHGTLLSFLLNRPVISISNHHKTSDLMKSMGQASYLLDIESLTLQGLVERFTLLSSQRETVCREVAERVADFQLALIRQYEGLFDDV